MMITRTNDELWATVKNAYVTDCIDLVGYEIRELISRQLDGLILSRKSKLFEFDWLEILSALIGYLAWLFIFTYFLLYRPVTKLVEFWRVRL